MRPGLGVVGTSTDLFATSSTRSVITCLLRASQDGTRTTTASTRGCRKERLRKGGCGSWRSSWRAIKKKPRWQADCRETTPEFPSTGPQLSTGYADVDTTATQIATGARFVMHPKGWVDLVKDTGGDYTSDLNRRGVRQWCLAFFHNNST